MEIKKYLNEKKALVEKHLKLSIEDKTIPKTLRDAMAYSLDAGGKRIRPVLVFAGAEAVGGSPEKVLPAAVALEMIHTFSLIHDDLPAMDDDSMRRGKPTNHKVFGEATAILAGDGLLAEAFYVLSQGNFEPSLLVDVIRDIAFATGGRGMTGGQVLDMNSTGKKITEGELTDLHLKKTGALLVASATAGAKLCGADDRQMTCLSSYGQCVGLAFQIADDILDIEGDERLLGKDIGSDVENAKSTYPALIGLAESKRRAAELTEKAVLEASNFGDAGRPLALIARYIIERDR